MQIRFMKYRKLDIRYLVLIFSMLSVAIHVAADEMTPCPLTLPGSATTKFGLYVKDLRTGEVVSDVNAGQLFVPASVTKALTTASVSGQLPVDARWTTNTYVEGRISGGVLHGNVVIDAVGDPTIESRYFKEAAGLPDSIAAALRSMGIDSISGRVTVSIKPWLDEQVPAGWMGEDLIWPYGTAHHSMNYKDNKMTLNLATGKSEPYSPGLKISRMGRKQVSKKRDSDVVYVSPGSKGSLSVAMPDPADAFCYAVTKAMDKRGIGVGGKTIDETGDKKKLYSHLSPSVTDVMRSLMFRSDNMMAEATLRLLAPNQSRMAAARRELSLWDARGINTDGIYIEDGSGLSRNDRMSPRFLGDVLEWMARSDDAERYTSFFPKAGREGTMRNFMKDSALDGRMATKTGSMSGVQCYAGYMLDDAGRPTHVVVIMVNGFKCDRSKLKKAIGDYLIGLDLK